MPLSVPDDPCGRPAITLATTRGVARFLMEDGYAVIAEMRLANGRRADLVGVDAKGRFVIVEIKSCREDFEVDTKWPDYRDYCDRLFFGVPTDFPMDLLPDDTGLIVADGFGAGLVREAPLHPLAGARRKALTLRFARQAAFSAMGSDRTDHD